MVRMFATLLVVSAATGPGVSWAQTDQRLHYQGVLTDAGGELLDVAVPMTFRVYDVPSGGEAIWEETHGDVLVSLGIFAVSLGSVDPEGNPISIAFDGSAPRYISLQVDIDSEMNPRQLIHAVPYALASGTAERARVADNADLLQGVPASALEESIEIDADISEHAGVADAHHARYTDGEAVAAVAEIGYVTADTRCDNSGVCQSIALADASNENNHLGLAAQGGAADTLYWGDAAVALGAHTVDTDTTLDEAAVDAFVANNGYLDGTHTAAADAHHARYTDGEALAAVAEVGYLTADTRCDSSGVCQSIALADASNANNHLGLTAQSGAADTLYWGDAPVALGAHTVDTDTTLDEAAVDAFVANNGYLDDTHTAVSDAHHTRYTDGEALAAVAEVGYLTADTRCDSSGVCQSIALGDASNGNNHLGLAAQAGPADTLYWGNAPVALGAHTVDTDTTLDEAAVDAFVANNGYLDAAAGDARYLSLAGGSLGGNLDVAGSVQLGDDADPCDSVKEGTLRFRSPAGLEACTGGEWVAALPRPVLWSGGCTTHGAYTGWVQYCLNGVDQNTAQDYFVVDPSGTVTFTKAGYYRIDFWCLSNSLNYAHIVLEKNGVYFHYGHAYSGNVWINNFAEATWPFAPGDQLTIGVYSGGGNNYNYHAWNNRGAHGRLQIHFAGPL